MFLFSPAQGGMPLALKSVISTTADGEPLDPQNFHTKNAVRCLHYPDEKSTNGISSDIAVASCRQHLGGTFTYT